MEVYLQSLGLEMWLSVKDGYAGPSTPPTDTADKNL